jgi:DNA-binding IclR family transcriptional regulator
VLRLVGRQGLKRDVDGPNAPKTIRELLDYLSAAKKRGYAQVFDTYVPGTSAMAAPIFRAGTRIPIGTMSVAGPIVRMTTQKMEQFAPLLLESAVAISKIGSGLPIFEQPTTEATYV